LILEQRINSKVCVKAGESASEPLALLTLAYEEIECFGMALVVQGKVGSAR
jgi:hypothetical protein